MGLLWAIYPGFCPLCRRASRRAMDLCEACEAAVAFNLDACPVCATPGLGPDVCAACVASPEPWGLAVAPFLYAPPLNRLVLGLKNGNGRMQARVLGALLVPALRRAYAGQALPDALVPVPLTWRRRRKRGFNQAALLGRDISRRLGVPLASRRLRRIRDAAPQQTLSRSARQRNLRRAFSASGMSGTVAIVDDVMTTGATLRACTNAVLKAGATEVHVWAIARTVDGLPQVR